jgi:hypothetical protein
MAKISSTDTLGWANVVMELIGLGVTTYAKVYKALKASGASEDDERLRALNTQYAQRILQAEQERKR